MRALVFAEPGVAEVGDVAEPRIGPNEMLVALRQVGICHSDFDLLAGRYIMPVNFPIIPGHEWAGEVVEVGAEVRRFAPGDRIVGECTVNGGSDHFGFSISGAAAELFKVREDWGHKLPDEVTWQQGATVEPFSCAYHALDTVGGVKPGDTVAVLGGGPIGLSATAAAAAMGARVILVEPTAHRRELGLRMGATEAIDPTAAPTGDQIRDLTGGAGAGVVIEASGNPAAMASAFDIAAFEGRLGFIGINVGGAAPAALGLIQSKALSIAGTIGSPDIWPETIRFLSATGLDLSPMVTATFDLADATGALAASEDRRHNVKVQMMNGQGAVP